MIGTTLGPYQVLAKLGEGGMGEVYRARDTRLKRDVAIKVLPEGFATDPDRLARFHREAEVLASLNHPNIAAVYGLEKADAITAIVLELVEGDTLADRLVCSAEATHSTLECDHRFSAACQFSTTMIGGGAVASACGVVMRRNRLPSRERCRTAPCHRHAIRGSRPPLDRHFPVQARVVGAVDFAHAACTERRKHLVRPELVARGQRHGCGEFQREFT